MQLNYRQNSRGLYILNKNDFDDIATMILLNYQPAMLKKAQPLDVHDLVEEHLYLDMKIARLSKDGRILGAIAFEDTVYEVYGDDGHAMMIDMPMGTILLDERLMKDERHIGRQRFTQVHEAAHWICHRQYHTPMGRNYEFRKMEDNHSIVCREERIEHPGGSANNTKVWSDSEWEEWQADNLAAALLMPKGTFIHTAREIFCSYGINADVRLRWNDNLALYDKIADELKDIYQVSKSAVRLRLVRCGLMAGINSR